MTVEKGVAIFFLVTCALTAVATLLFACIHFPHGWWCMLIVLPLVIAFLVPAICLGYNDFDDALKQVDMERPQFENCRMLGWSVAAVLVLFTYSVPIIVWYNSSTFSYVGVLVVDCSITSALFSFVLWRRVFTIT